MLSDVLSSFADISSVVAREEDYLLARVESRGGEYVAEVVPSGSPGADDTWPEVEGVLKPLASKAIREVRIRVFDIGDRELLAESVARSPMEETEALKLALALVPVLGRLASRNRLLGYLGPEGVLMGEGGPLVLGGGRGCPSGPFTAPEAQDGPAGDPRSMVFALGTLIFRCIAGTDDKQRQIEAWRNLSPPTRSLLERAVGELPEERLPSVTIFGRAIEHVLSGGEPSSATETAGTGSPGEPDELPAGESMSPSSAGSGATAPEGFVRKRGHASSVRRRRRSIPAYLVGFVVIVAAAVAVVLLLPELLSGGDGGGAPRRGDSTAAAVGPDSVAVGDRERETLTADSSVSAADSLPPTPGPSIIWVSNRAPGAGAEVDYRTGVLAGYSHVYPFRGGRPMEGSLLMLRRDDPASGMQAQAAYPDAAAIMERDSSLETALVDLTVLVGADLRYDGINSGILFPSANPAGTLYVDVVNQGMEFPPDGSTPAHRWLADVLDGSAFRVPGRGEWLLRVVQTRWGDRGRNDEVPLTYGLDSTAFLYRRGSEHCRAAEAAVREAIQPIPRAVAGPPQGITVPDIWILVGSPRTGQSP